MTVPTGSAVDIVAHAANTGPDAVCRGCAARGLECVVDLGRQPPAERFVSPAELSAPDLLLDLRIMVCPTCWLVQLAGEPVPPGDEPGGLAFSVSSTMRAHVEGLVDDVMTRVRGGLAPETGATTDVRIVEVASHGNRLAELFRGRGESSLLVESVPWYAEDARSSGVPTRQDRLTPEVAGSLVEEQGSADLFVDTFYLAHDPRPSEFLAGVARLLADDGLAVFEFDHLLPVVLETQYDGFRHGHASYLSLSAFGRLLDGVGLAIEDAIATPAYGGSVRAYVRRAGRGGPGPAAKAILAAESDAGLLGLEAFRSFADRVAAARRAFRLFLDDCRRAGDTIVAYGAPSRGNTLLNSSGATAADVLFAIDRAPSKHGRYLPGSRIPIVPVDRVFDARPDYLLVLTWDLRDEVMAQMAGVREWGCQFVVPLPELAVFD